MIKLQITLNLLAILAITALLIYFYPELCEFRDQIVEEFSSLDWRL